MRLSATIKGQTFQFKSIKEVLAKASELKSGDVLAGISASSSLERMAAKVVLSELQLKDIYENSSIPYERDEVTRVIYDDISRPIYESVKGWTVLQQRQGRI